jgi:hypothetical protein
MNTAASVAVVGMPETDQPGRVAGNDVELSAAVGKFDTAGCEGSQTAKLALRANPSLQRIHSRLKPVIQSATMVGVLL